MKNNIVYLHIQKTAGSTLETCFKSLSNQNNKIIYTRGSSLGLNDNFSLKHFQNINLNQNLNILGGHFVFSEDCKQFELYTLVRNIYDVFLSNLYYQYNQNYLYNKINIENFNNIEKVTKINLNFTKSDLVTIKKLLKNNFLTSNTITKTIAGIPFEKFFYVTNDYKINDADFETAIHNLKYFSYIGFSEKINDFIKILLRKLSIKSASYSSVNISKHDRNFLNKLKIDLNFEIIEYNKYDFKIINFIKEKFK